MNPRGINGTNSPTTEGAGTGERGAKGAGGFASLLNQLGVDTKAAGNGSKDKRQLPTQPDLTGQLLPVQMTKLPAGAKGPAVESLARPLQSPPSMSNNAAHTSLEAAGLVARNGGAPRSAGANAAKMATPAASQAPGAKPVTDGVSRKSDAAADATNLTKSSSPATPAAGQPVRPAATPAVSQGAARTIIEATLGAAADKVAAQEAPGPALTLAYKSDTKRSVVARTEPATIPAPRTRPDLFDFEASPAQRPAARPAEVSVRAERPAPGQPAATPVATGARVRPVFTKNDGVAIVSPKSAPETAGPAIKTDGESAGKTATKLAVVASTPRTAATTTGATTGATTAATMGATTAATTAAPAPAAAPVLVPKNDNAQVASRATAEVPRRAGTPVTTTTATVKTPTFESEAPRTETAKPATVQARSAQASSPSAPATSAAGKPATQAPVAAVTPAVATPGAPAASAPAGDAAPRTDVPKRAPGKPVAAPEAQATRQPAVAIETTAPTGQGTSAPKATPSKAGVPTALVADDRNPVAVDKPAAPESRGPAGSARKNPAPVRASDEGKDAKEEAPTVARAAATPAPVPGTVVAQPARPATAEAPAAEIAGAPVKRAAAGARVQVTAEPAELGTVERRKRPAGDKSEESADASARSAQPGVPAAVVAPVTSVERFTLRANSDNQSRVESVARGEREAKEATRAAETPAAAAGTPVPMPEQNRPNLDPTFRAPAPPSFEAPAPVAYVPQAAAPIVERATEDAGLSVVVMPQNARVTVESREGDLALHLRIKDGSAEVSMGGSLSPMFEQRSAEVQSVLADQGLSLGRFDLSDNRQDQQASQQPERAGDDTASKRPGHGAKPDAANTNDTASEPQPRSNDGRIHVTA